MKGLRKPSETEPLQWGTGQGTYLHRSLQVGPERWAFVGNHLQLEAFRTFHVLLIAHKRLRA